MSELQVLEILVCVCCSTNRGAFWGFGRRFWALGRGIFCMYAWGFLRFRILLQVQTIAQRNNNLPRVASAPVNASARKGRRWEQSRLLLIVIHCVNSAVGDILQLPYGDARAEIWPMAEVIPNLPQHVGPYRIDRE